MLNTVVTASSMLNAHSLRQLCGWAASARRCSALPPNASSSTRLPRPQLPSSRVAPRCQPDDAGQAATITTAPPPVKKFNVRPVTRNDVVFTFARSGGAGGQNVNKVETKVDMRLDVGNADWLPGEVRDEIRRAARNKFNKEGQLVVTATEHRTQGKNIDEALSKLQVIIDAAVEAITPKEVDPETKKRVEKQIKAGQQARLDNKKKASAKKKERSNKNWD